jgi:hypothetical protein
MRFRQLALLSFIALIAIPSFAVAQRGGGRSRGGDASSPGDRSARSQFRWPSKSDIEDLNPAALMLDKKKKFPLSDEQVTQLKALEKKFRDSNAPLLAEYDSLRRNARPLQNSDSKAMPSPAEMQNMQMAIRGLRQAVDALRIMRKNDVDETVAYFTDPAQKSKAEDFIKEQQEEFAKLFPGGDDRG